MTESSPTDAQEPSTRDNPWVQGAEAKDRIQENRARRPAFNLIAAAQDTLWFAAFFQAAGYTRSEALSAAVTLVAPTAIDLSDLDLSDLGTLDTIADRLEGIASNTSRLG